MNDDPLEEFLRDTLKGQPPLSPPSPDFRQQIMQRVVAEPMYQRSRSPHFVLMGGILLALALTVGGGSLLVAYGPVVLNAIATVLRWLSWSVDPGWVLAALMYGLAARIVLTLGILVTVDRKRAFLKMQWN